MTEEKNKFLKSLIYPSAFVLLLWIIQLFTYVTSINLYNLGIHPRSLDGLIGIITGPLIHAGFPHLISNSIPMLILGTGIFYFYPNAAVKVVITIYFLTDIMVWLFARHVWHVGASGVIYGFLAFIFFSGIFRRDNRSIGLSLLVTFLYGGLIWGVLPGMKGISWESHLFGGLVGILTAFIFKRSDPYKKYDWEDEPDQDDSNDLEISYDKDKNDF